MAICDTKIYSESGELNGTDAIPETSGILDGKGSTRDGKTSPRLSNRRSSRVRKRDGTSCSEVSYSSSDDSDPNLQMGDSILIDEEEKLIIKAESDVDADQRADKQLLAVAILKSVIETNVEKSSKTNGEAGGGGGGVCKVEHVGGHLGSSAKDDRPNDGHEKKIGLHNSIQGIHVHNKADENIKKEIMNSNGHGAVVPLVKVEDKECSNATVTDPPNAAQKSHETKIPSNPALLCNALKNDRDGGANITKRLKLSQDSENMKLKGDVSDSSVSTKSTSYRGTRSRSKGAKGGRTMALKGAYASIREAPRGVVLKPINVSLPVPNPILHSPATQETIENEQQAVRSNIKLQQHQEVKIEENIAIQPMTTCSQDTFITNETQTPAPTISSTIVGPQNPQIEPTTSATTISRPRTNSVSFMVPNHNHPVNQSYNITNNLPSRRRIFSIDLDPEGFDFDMSIGVTCNTPPPDYVDSVSALPPITSSSSVTGVKDVGLESHSRNNQNATGSVQDSSMPTSTRSRGMSFELFSFNHNESVPSSDFTDLKEEALNGGRPRGDSIIFDPVSFSDGGIHEETALLKLRRNSIVLEETDEIELMNTPGFIEGPATNNMYQKRPQSQVNHRPANTNSTSRHQQARRKAMQGIKNKSTSRNSNNGGYHLVRQTKSSYTTINTSKSKSQVTLTVVSGNNMPNSEDTIHMPQGSAAAAAAAASLSSQIIPCSLNGTISHTACPLELLNKGGRIGIYLPDARRERIAKFHSKRKNRIWRKRIKYDCRKKLADSRPRIKGRFVKSLEE